MIVMNLELDNIYGFKDFKINFSYPKKIVKSTIDNEFFQGCPRFRYKKAIVLMGANATGKTSLGRSLLRIFRFIETADFVPLVQMIANPKIAARISIDFVNEGYILHRLVINYKQVIEGGQKTYKLLFSHESATINSRDTYETVVKRLEKKTIPEGVILSEYFKSVFGTVEYCFALENEERSHDTSKISNQLFLKVLKAVIGTLDPTLTDISVLKGVEDTYVIRRDGQEIILQKGKLINKDFLSSGTVRGIDIAILVATIIAKDNAFYYSDEHFSFIQTDLEKRIFGIMLEHLQENEQLIFTTHNTDMLDLNLPKHSYAFLGKRKEDDGYKVSVLYASDVLKRNTDSIRYAAENDVFSSIPDESLLDSLSNISG